MSEYSSGEEDGNAEWKKAINSVANDFSSVAKTPPFSDHVQPPQPPKPTHYQRQLQRLLDDMLEKSLVMVKNDDDVVNGDNDNHARDSDQINYCAHVRLFRNSTPGVFLQHIEEPKEPRRRPKILPGVEIDEKSKKFKRRLQSVAIDGEAIMAEAKKLEVKSLKRLEAKDAAAKKAAKKEEERVAELKRVRGEKWLPSIARNKI